MKIENLKKSLLALACVGAISMAPESRALTIGDASYVGQIDNGAPASAPNERDYINYLTTLAAGATAVQIPIGTGEIYDRVGSVLAGPFTAATAVGVIKEDPTDGAIDATGFLYVYAKYGGEARVWYNASGFSGIMTVPTAGLSHLSTYNPGGGNTPGVPDGGTTLALMGLGFAGLSLLRRKIA